MVSLSPFFPASDASTAAVFDSVRHPPHSIEAEQALLGAILVNNRAIERVTEFLLPDHFAIGPHGSIFLACRTLIDGGMVADPITLKRHFDAAGDLVELGGSDYLLRLADSAVSVINAGEYGRLIHDLYLRRQLIDIGETVVNRAFAGDLAETADDQIEKAEASLFALAVHGSHDAGPVPFSQSMTSALKAAQAAHQRQGQLSGVTTGFTDLNRKLGGLHGSDLIILAGRPSMGKTALATNIAYNAARAHRTVADADGRRTVDGAIVAVFSLEMSAEQLAMRVVAEQTRIPSDHIRRGMVGDRFPLLVEKSVELQHLPLFIDDTPAITISAIRTRARRLARSQGLGMIVIDYLQLIAPSAGTRHENRVQELSEITRGLKALAKDLNVPVLALSQLSRAVEQREDKRPQLSDLRESGTIEQDADVVMFIFRAQYYLEREEPTQRADESEEKYIKRHGEWMQRCEKAHNIADVIVAKNRHGPIANVKMFFEGEYTRFADLEIGDE